ncbi:MAG: gamma-glutamyl-gamma-aminobutyrate hydrolase family protein [Candidatus Woesearchaeota archaeon]
MNILVVDNESMFFDELIALLRGHHVTVINYHELRNEDTSAQDCIILSGSHIPVSNFDDKYGVQVDILKHSSRPVLGICVGFALVQHAYGHKDAPLEEHGSQAIKVEIEKKDKLFKGITKIEAIVDHRYDASATSEHLDILAISERGIEIVKHKKKLIYGINFHPELTSPKAIGKKLIENFLNQVKPT